MPIRVLSPEVAAKLAAGEVVERPASVVRELVDNAIDSGARRVSVVLAGGGLDLIRVADDGVGMDRHGLRLCVQKHATSKLRAIEDLGALGSLGFRGEALYAIAGVSRLRIRSRPPGQPGAEFEYHGLALARETPSGCPEGTQVEVRDLFHNTPARLKFLKGPSAEAARAEQLMRRYALGRPGVAFELEIDGRAALRSPGDGDPLAAVATVYGWRVAERLLPVEAEDGAGRVEGYVGPPELARSNRVDMQLFVNGRWVQSGPLLYAVREAYSTLLMTGRFPLAVLHVRVPPDRLDVNVHPAKSDVRFADERGVAGLVGRAVRAAVLASAGALGASGAPVYPQFGFGDGGAPTSAATPADGENPGASAWSARATARDGAVCAPGDPRGGASLAAGGAGEGEGRLPPLRIIGQLGCMYIIAEGPEGLYLVDQHAAHERVLLERLQDGSAVAGSQRLLEPVVVPLSPAQAEDADRWAEQLTTLGFDASPFGRDALALRAVPAGVPPDRAATLLAALEEGVEGLSDEDERRRATLATLACHGAIRAGQALEIAEMRALLRDLEATRVPTACAHGRPTLLEIPKGRLEREFGRKGPR